MHSPHTTTLTGKGFRCIDKRHPDTSVHKHRLDTSGDKCSRQYEIRSGRTLSDARCEVAEGAVISCFYINSINIIESYYCDVDFFFFGSNVEACVRANTQNI